MLKSQIIAKAQLYTDDLTELSDSEMGDLFDKVYADVCSLKPWEFTKASHAVTVSGTTTPLPTDFLSLTQNAQHNDNAWYGSNPVVFVGAIYRPYQVVNWSERRQYNNRPGYAYLDIPNGNLVFTYAVGDTVEFDYHRQMPTLTNNESPAFPEEFHHIIYHGMAIEQFMLEMFEKARSYAPENEMKYKDYLNRMHMWNARLIQL
jgi:hypothetical protein